MLRERGASIVHRTVRTEAARISDWPNVGNVNRRLVLGRCAVSQIKRLGRELSRVDSEGGGRATLFSQKEGQNEKKQRIGDLLSFLQAARVVAGAAEKLRQSMT